MPGMTAVPRNPLRNTRQSLSRAKLCTRPSREKLSCVRTPLSRIMHTESHWQANSYLMHSDNCNASRDVDECNNNKEYLAHVSRGRINLTAPAIATNARVPTRIALTNTSAEEALPCIAHKLLRNYCRVDYFRLRQLDKHSNRVQTYKPIGFELGNCMLLKKKSYE